MEAICVGSINSGIEASLREQQGLPYSMTSKGVVNRRPPFDDFRVRPPSPREGLILGPGGPHSNKGERGPDRKTDRDLPRCERLARIELKGEEVSISLNRRWPSELATSLDRRRRDTDSGATKQ